MSTNVPYIATEGLKEVINVADFARRYRLPKDEEYRLIKLFGLFASKYELVMNARREPSFR
jgi:hypothetical protein